MYNLDHLIVSANGYDYLWTRAGLGPEILLETFFQSYLGVFPCAKLALSIFLPFSIIEHEQCAITVPFFEIAHRRMGSMASLNCSHSLVSV